MPPILLLIVLLIAFVIAIVALLEVLISFPPLSRRLQASANRRYIKDKLWDEIVLIESRRRDED